MKLILLASETENKELLRELKRILSANPQNTIEQYTLGSENLQRIQNGGADLVITINLSGFEFTTLTGGISYNLWNTKFVHFLLKRNLKNEPILEKPLSISMFFYCLGKEYKEYLQKKYPNLPYLDEITGWEKGTDRKSVRSNAEKMAAVICETAHKCNLPLALSSMQEAEIYFRQLKEELPEMKSARQHIDEVLDEALSTENHSVLLSLIPYMESGKGKLAWKYTGEARRILQILYIVRLEEKYHMELFCRGCRSKEELTEKYLVMLFALRRLVFGLSEESVEEAEQFLKSAGLSPFALHMVLQNELLPADLSTYQQLTNLFSENWNEEEKLLFIGMAEMAGEESMHGQQ